MDRELLSFVSVLCGCLSFVILTSRKFDALDKRRFGLRLLTSTCFRIRSKESSLNVKIGNRLDPIRILIVRTFIGDFSWLFYVWQTLISHYDSMFKDTTGFLGPGMIFLLFSWIFKSLSINYLLFIHTQVKRILQDQRRYKIEEFYSFFRLPLCL